MPAAPATGGHTPRHVRHPETQVELGAWLPALGNLDTGAAEPEAIAKADICLGDPLGRQVFAKTTGHETFRQLRQLAPLGVAVLGRIVMQGLVHTAMMIQVGLRVPFQAKPTEVEANLGRLLGDHAERSPGNQPRDPATQQHGQTGLRHGVRR